MLSSRWIVSLFFLSTGLGFAVLSFYLSAFFKSETLYNIGLYAGLLTAVAFGITVPKKRDEFRCPTCHILLGNRAFLQLGSEFRRQVKNKYPAGCPVCRSELFPVEVSPNVV